jgi:hypothetical protein
MKKVQTLNEEIQKMRKLMSFNINENSHDSLSEENIDKSLSEDVKQCTIKGGPPEVVTMLQEDINNLLEERLSEILKTVKVSIGSKIGDINTRFEQFVNYPEFSTINFSDYNLDLLWNEEGFIKQTSGRRPTWDLTIPLNKKLVIDTPIQISEFKEELLSKNICYKMLYDRYDTIKNQIDTGVVEVVIESIGEYPVKFGIQIANSKTNNFIKNAQSLTLNDFRNPFSVVLSGKRRKDKIYGEVWVQGGTPLAVFRLYGADVPKDWDIPTPTSNKCYCNDIVTGEQIEYPCDGELPKRCKKGGTPIAFDFVVESKDNFDFDGAILTDEAKKIIDKNIVDEWDTIAQNRKDGYLDFIKDKKINVNAYASIDALSNFKVSGTYKPCRKTGQLRKDYNKCLSQARAEAVVEYLKTIADGAFKDINFVATGMGETNQFSGLKWDNEKQPKTNSSGVQTDEKSPYSTTETKSDRRFEVKFPKWHTED